jgi:3-hydroxy-9,10-secoandrosta-1,3,5(10)-triene-9,17-dione monooxygenase
VVVEKAFVPEHRTHKFIDGFNRQNPGRSYNDGWIFRIPFMQVFLRSITNGQIGALQALLDLTVEYTQSKVVMGKPLVADPDLQLAVGQARAGIFEMKSTLRAGFAKLAEYARRDETPPMPERLLFKYHSAAVANRCLELADALVRATGSGLVYKKFTLERILRNMLTAQQHAAAHFRGYGRVLGAELLGRSEPDILC